MPGWSRIRRCPARDPAVFPESQGRSGTRRPRRSCRIRSDAGEEIAQLGQHPPRRNSPRFLRTVTPTRHGSSSRSCCPTASRNRRPPIVRCRSMIPRRSGGSRREGSTSFSPSSSRARRGPQAAPVPGARKGARSSRSAEFAADRAAAWWPSGPARRSSSSSPGAT